MYDLRKAIENAIQYIERLKISDADVLSNCEECLIDTTLSSLKNARKQVRWEDLEEYWRNDEETYDMSSKEVMEAELVKQLLHYVSYHAGADITITVESHDGHKASARLYDHPVLVDGLFAALEDFQKDKMEVAY